MSAMAETKPARMLLSPGHEPAIVCGHLPSDLPLVSLSAGELLVPALINAHDHGYGIQTLDFGAVDDALELWIPAMRMRPKTDPYLEALVAFSRLAKGGVGATMHCHNSLNVNQLINEAEAVIKAAGDVGIRLGLSCPMLDHDAWAYDGGPERLRPYLSADDWNLLSPSIPAYAPVEVQLEAVEAVAKAHQNPMVDVQYGPIGPQWCSNKLLEKIAEASALNNRRIHMHLLESPRQRKWLDRRFPQGIVKYLDDIGFLSPRLAVAHGVQLTKAECELLAERGVQLVSNPSANLRLRSGVAALNQAIETKLDFALGLDGAGLDDDQDLWREMRLTYLMHGGTGLKRSFTASIIFDAVLNTGAKVVNCPVKEDYAIIDYAGLTENSLFDDLDAAQVLLTRMTASYVKDLYVNNRAVLRNGKLTGVDYTAACQSLLEQAKHDLPRLEKERQNAHKLSAALSQYYAGW